MTETNTPPSAPAGAKTEAAPKKPGRIIIPTKRFLIRTLTLDDPYQKLGEWFADEELIRYLGGGRLPKTDEQLRRYVKNHDTKKNFLFGVFVKENDHFIGLYNIRCDMNHKSGAFSVLIGDRGYWGADVVLETRERLLDFCFVKLPLEKVHGSVYQTNHAALFNYKAQDWPIDGVRKKHVIDRGQRIDVINFAMFKDMWLDRRRAQVKAERAAKEAADRLEEPDEGTDT